MSSVPSPSCTHVYPDKKLCWKRTEVCTTIFPVHSTSSSRLPVRLSLFMTWASCLHHSPSRWGWLQYHNMYENDVLKIVLTIHGVSKLSVQLLMGEREHQDKRFFPLDLFIFSF